jgi:Holliday junction DNA helicase RuvA
MIGLIRGKVLIKKAPDLLVDVQGVGYELQVSMMTFCELPDVNAEITLFTHFSVREDAQVLFGFLTQDERNLFRTLLKVNGVGPKMALAILSTLSVPAFIQYVHANDVTALTKIPGVGKKTAERLILDVKDRLPSPEADIERTDSVISNTSPVSMQKDKEEEAINALLALGYKPAQASKMIMGLSDQQLSVEEMIRQALKASLS